MKNTKVLENRTICFCKVQHCGYYANCVEVNSEHDNSNVNNFMIGQLLEVQSPEKQRLLYKTACQKVLNASSANRKLSFSMV